MARLCPQAHIPLDRAGVEGDVSSHLAQGKRAERREMCPRSAGRGGSFRVFGMEGGRLGLSELEGASSTFWVEKQDRREARWWHVIVPRPGQSQLPSSQSGHHAVPGCVGCVHSEAAHLPLGQRRRV